MYLYMLILVSCFICVSANYGSVFDEENRQVIKLYDKMPSKTGIVLYNKFLVTTEKPLEIMFDKNYDNIKCVSHPFGSSLNHLYKIKMEESQSSIWVAAVTDYISTIWLCELYKKETTKHISFEIVVKHAKPPQLILINHLVLPTQRRIAVSETYHIAEYYFERGEQIDVACINPDDDSFSLDLKFDFVNKNAEQFAQSTKSNFGVGFRTTLQDNHNNTHMTCTSLSEDNIYTVVNVTFLQISFHDTMTFYMNQKKSIGDHLREDSRSFTLHFNYAYFSNEINLNIKTYLNVGGVSLDHPTCYFCEEFLNEWIFEGNIAYNIKPDKMAKIVYKARNVDDHLIKQTAVVSFTPINLKDRRYLEVIFSPNEPRRELYQYASRERKNIDYVYEYINEQTIKLNCSKVPPILSTYLYFNKSEPIQLNKHSHQQYVSLSAKEHNSIFECSLRIANGSLLDRIRILFFMKTPATVTTDSTTEMTTSTTQSANTTMSTTTTQAFDTDETDHDFPWIIAMTAILMIIVLISVCAFVYRKIKQKRFTQVETIYENLQAEREDPIPPYPAQWQNNNLIESEQTEENSLYNTADAIYTKPIPKSQRGGKLEVIYANKERKKTNEDPVEDIYAKLDTPSQVYGNQATSSDVSKDLYSKVLPKSVRNQKTYANVSPQRLASISETDYVQPTYCEPTELYK